MEEVKHIKNITVENFKCFDHFSAGDFGLYNIILGDNNVGKTSFLEALLFEENHTQSISNLQGALYSKKIATADEDLINSFNPLPFFTKKDNGDYFRVNIGFSDNSYFDNKYETEKIENLPGDDRYQINSFNTFGQRNREVLKISTLGGIFYRSFNIYDNGEPVDLMMPIIAPSIFYAKDLVQYYSDNFSDSKIKKGRLIEQLRTIISNISNVELAVNSIDNTPILGIWLNNSDSLLPLPMFGDGTVRLFRMIMEIIALKNKYLCIDEIDTGIHYSKYKDFGRIVLKTAATNNVQLFISTHNNEFLKSFKEVLEEKDFANYQNDTKCFTLKRLPDESIKAYKYDFEEFEFAIEQENELR